MSNPADEHIATLIEELVNEATRFSTRDEKRDKLIKQIAELRKSMEPTIIQKVKKD